MRPAPCSLGSLLTEMMGCGERFGEERTFVGLLLLNRVTGSDRVWRGSKRVSSPRSHTSPNITWSRKTVNGRAQATHPTDTFPDSPLHDGDLISAKP